MRNGPKSQNPIRDQKLLDALEKVPQESYSGPAWRSVREGRDPLACARSGGRWDDGTFDVLYTSMTREVAIEERRFHLYKGQPFPPSKARYELFELRVELQALVAFETIEALARLGLDESRYGQLAYWDRESEYVRSQEIAEACSFLGADGIKVPSARATSSSNLIVFCEQDTGVARNVVRSHGLIGFDD